MFYPRIFSILGFVAVALGAFGAHGLKDKVTLQMLENWKTASLYLFIHILIGIFSYYFTNKKRASFFFLLGCIVFPFSLYLMVLLNLPILGAITPIGGVSFLLGWIFLLIDIRKKN